MKVAMSFALLVVLPACSQTAPTPESPPDLRDVIEAIFLGSGPLAAGDCVGPGVWVSYPRDSTVTLQIASSIDGAGRQALESAIADLTGVIAGRFRLESRPNIEADPLPGPLQITSADVAADVIVALCSPGGSGCTKAELIGGVTLNSARCVHRVGTSSRLKVHELGHAVGLCHVDRLRMPAAVMADPPGASPQDRFTSLELDAIRAVSAANLEPGATRQMFRDAGLIK
jgi:hypothetical protein